MTPQALGSMLSTGSLRRCRTLPQRMRSRALPLPQHRGASAPVYRRMDASRQHALLQRIVERCQFDPTRDRAKPTPVVVFDLDGTLFDNRPRTRVILNELAEKWHAAHPEHAKRLARLRQEEMAYLLADTLERVGVTDERASRRGAGLLARPLLRRRAPSSRRAAPWRRRVRQGLLRRGGDPRLPDRARSAAHGHRQLPEPARPRLPHRAPGYGARPEARRRDGRRGVQAPRGPQARARRFDRRVVRQRAGQLQHASSRRTRTARASSSIRSTCRGPRRSTRGCT